MSGPVEITRAAWGEDLPDWVLSMAEQCAASSQSQVARKMGRSAATISQILRRKYPAPLGGIEQVYRGVFENLVVECPALGTVPANECRDWQLKAVRFVNVNSLRVRMFRACNSCPRFKDKTNAR